MLFVLHGDANYDQSAAQTSILSESWSGALFSCIVTGPGDYGAGSDLSRIATAIDRLPQWR